MPAIIIDNGSYLTKADFTGADIPRFVFKTTLGSRKSNVEGEKSEYVGDEAEKNAGLLDLRYPIVRGAINNWDDVEKIWNHIFVKELKVKTNQNPVLLTERPDNSPAYREKAAQIMFEKFNIPSLFIANEGVMALYANGLQNGVVLSCGDGVTHALAVKDYYAVKHSLVESEFSGSDLTGYLNKLLNEKGFSAEMNIVREIKQKVCYVPLDFQKELQKTENLKHVYELPDGQKITIDNERIKCAEALFQPSLLGLGCGGIHKLINESVLKCDEKLQSKLYSNVVLSGGTTMFTGIVERLENELTTLAPNSKPKIKALQHRNYAAWVGASCLASLPTFKQLCITKQEYDENGSSIVHRKLSPY